MTVSVNDSPLSIFEMIGSMVERSEEAVKEAQANGAFCSSCGIAPVMPGEDLCASCHMQKEAAGKEQIQQMDFSKLADILERAAEVVYKTASDTGPASDQPKSSHGPRDTETRIISKGRIMPDAIAKMFQPGTKTGLEEDVMGGRNHAPTDYDRRIPLSRYGVAYDASTKTAERQMLIEAIKEAADATVSQNSVASPERAQLIQWIKQAAEQAAGQPVSSHGPDDDETGKKPSGTDGKAKLSPQEAERHAKKDLPLSEPESKRINVHGKTQEKSASVRFPSPEVEQARDFLTKIAQQGCTCGGQGVCQFCLLEQAISQDTQQRYGEV